MRGEGKERGKGRGKMVFSQTHLSRWLFSFSFFFLKGGTTDHILQIVCLLIVYKLSIRYNFFQVKRERGKKTSPEKTLKEDKIN